MRGPSVTPTTRTSGLSARVNVHDVEVVSDHAFR
jgi:hypothetical protein